MKQKSAEFLHQHFARETANREKHVFRAYDHAIQSRVQQGAKQKQQAVVIRQAYEHRPPIRPKQKIALKITNPTGAPSREQRLAEVVQHTRDNAWTTDVLHFSVPQRTDPRTFVYEKSDVPDIRMQFPLYSSFSKDGIFREPDYTVHVKRKPRKMVAPRMEDYEPAASSDSGTGDDEEEKHFEFTQATIPTNYAHNELSREFVQEPAVEPTEATLPHQATKQQRPKTRPASAPLRRLETALINPGTIMESLLPRAAYSRPSSALGVRCSGFQNIVHSPLHLEEADDDEDFGAPVLSPLSRSASRKGSQAGSRPGSRKGNSRSVSRASRSRPGSAQAQSVWEEQPKKLALPELPEPAYDNEPQYEPEPAVAMPATRPRPGPAKPMPTWRKPPPVDASAPVLKVELKILPARVG